MICLKGCREKIDMLYREIEMFNELLAQQTATTYDIAEQKRELIKKHAAEMHVKDNKIEELTQANLRAATAFKNAETDKLLLEARVKELESELLNFKKKSLPPEWIKSNGEPFIINDPYNEPVTGQPLFSEDPSITKYPAKKKK